MSKRLGALAVVALVLLAGCAGGLTGDSGSADDATTSETATTDPVQSLSEQPWATGDEDIDFETLREGHSATLANASAFEFTVDADSEDGTEYKSTVAVDHDTDRLYFDMTSWTTTNGAPEISEWYVADGAHYSRDSVDGNTTYGSESLSDGGFEEVARDQSEIQATGGVADAMEWEYLGVTGDGRYQFEADSITTSDETSFEAENVTRARGNLVVDESGYVAEFSLSLTVKNAEGVRDTSLSYATTGVGETTVDKPAWVDEVDDDGS